MHMKGCNMDMVNYSNMTTEELKEVVYLLFINDGVTSYTDIDLSSISTTIPINEKPPLFINNSNWVCDSNTYEVFNRYGLVEDDIQSLLISSDD
jgi:hypothetical protein